MQTRSDQFLSLSVLLTGFSRFELLGRAVAGDYLSQLDAVLPAGVVDELLAAYERLPHGDEREGAVAADILADPKIGLVARNLILLWYCGTWTALPAAWHNAYGASPQQEQSGVVSAQAYQAGLQWEVAGAHPPGSRQQGFASWSMAPERSGL
jgi:hypothetical protein